MYSFDSRVRYSECDAVGDLTLTALVNYLQDCSTFHTESLGHGVAYCREHHFAWFIMAWQIEIARLPRYCDPITISTWCYGARRTQAGRNFTITAPDGTPYVRADSLWFVFDTQAQRPIRIPDGEHVYIEDAPRLDMPPTERRLADVDDGIACEPVTVTRHHLDSNAHVNNAQYLAMAVDAVASLRAGANGVGEGIDGAGIAGAGSTREGAVATPSRICVEYRRMALLGDVIIPRVGVGDATCDVELAGADGMAFAVVRLEYGRAAR